MLPFNLKDTLGVPTWKLREWMEDNAPTKGDGWWFFPSRSGKKAVTLVAHIDTHHDGGGWGNRWNKKDEEKKKDPWRLTLFDRIYGVYWSPDGLGADDRAGVWALFQIYRRAKDEDCPNLLFCDEEETGAKGAGKAAKEAKGLLVDTTLFFVELDRRGQKDAVYYNGEPKDFQDYIENFGFKHETGSFSDISVIGRALKICAVNLSVGYYSQHTKTETLYVEVLMKTIGKTLNICADGNKAQKTWAFKPTDYGRYASEYDSYGYGGWVGQGDLYPYDRSLDVQANPNAKHGDRRTVRQILEDRAWKMYMDRPKKEMVMCWFDYRKKVMPRLIKEYQKASVRAAKKQAQKDAKDRETKGEGAIVMTGKNGPISLADPTYTTATCACCQKGGVVHQDVLRWWYKHSGFYVCIPCRRVYPHLIPQGRAKAASEYLI